MNYKKGLIYGIDLGVGSVGWAVLDDDGQTYVDKGVVKFEQGQKAEDRRNARGTRRRYHRRKYRIERLQRVFKEYNLPVGHTTDSNLLDKRIKGLEDKLELQDITNIIVYFAIHRGYISFDSETRESDIVIELKKKYEYPCLIQKELLKINNLYRNRSYVDDNPILHEDYNKELIKTLETQAKYYPNISGEFIAKVMDIVNTKRKFWEGPGAPQENALSPFGRYRNRNDLEEYKKDNNYRKYLFQDLIGRCSVYVDEKKASMYNYYAEEFNYYNDFVNLRFPSDEIDEHNAKYFNEIKDYDSGRWYKLTTEAIALLKEKIFEVDSVNINKILKDTFGVTTYRGNRIDSNGKPDFYRFQTTKKIKAKIKNQNLYNILYNNKDIYNKSIEIIQMSPDFETTKELLEDLYNKYNIAEIKDEDFINELSLINHTHGQKTKVVDDKRHSFSEKALRKYLEYMYKDNINSSKAERKYKDEIASDVKEEIIEEYLANIEEGKLKYINSKFIDDIVASPATKKSLRKAEAVLNKLFSKYGYPEYICIENTKLLLSPDRQKEYEQRTLDNKNQKDKAQKALETDGIEVNDTNIIKYLLMQETDCKCAYCNKDIKINNCEIEHIIPRSISADDSYDNKTVACNACNSSKNDKSPYEYLRTDGRYEEFKERVQANSKLSYKKKKYMLFEDDLNKYQKKFVNSNLNDTAYATNELANQINLFKEAYLESIGEELKTRVLRIPGQFTAMCRRKFKIEKDRDKEYHHAVDAVIIANYANTKIGKLMDMVQNDKDKYWQVSNLNDYRDDKELFDNIFLNKGIIDVLKNADFSNTRFSYEVKKRINGQLFDAKVRKAVVRDGKYYYIDQIDNIYDLAHADVEKVIKDNDNLLIKQKNPKLYQKLQDIIEQYKDVKGNQFVNYCKENYKEEIKDFNPQVHGIRVSNKKNADVVIKLRFLSAITTPFILEKDSVDTKEGTINVCTNLASYGTRVFKDDERLYFMPMYKVFVNKDGSLNKNSKYYKEVYNKFVGKEDVVFYMDLFTNDYVRFEDKKGNVVEGFVSYFHKTLNKVVIKNANSVTTSSKNLKKIQSDILGLYNLNF